MAELALAGVSFLKAVVTGLSGIIDGKQNIKDAFHNLKEVDARITRDVAELTEINPNFDWSSPVGLAVNRACTNARVEYEELRQVMDKARIARADDIPHILRKALRKKPSQHVGMYRVMIKLAAWKSPFNVWDRCAADVEQFGLRLEKMFSIFSDALEKVAGEESDVDTSAMEYADPDPHMEFPGEFDDYRSTIELDQPLGPPGSGWCTVKALTQVGTDILSYFAGQIICQPWRKLAGTPAVRELKVHEGVTQAAAAMLNEPLEAALDSAHLTATAFEFVSPLLATLPASEVLRKLEPQARKFVNNARKAIDLLLEFRVHYKKSERLVREAHMSLFPKAKSCIQMIYDRKPSVPPKYRQVTSRVRSLLSKFDLAITAIDAATQQLKDAANDVDNLLDGMLANSTPGLPMPEEFAAQILTTTLSLSHFIVWDHEDVGTKMTLLPRLRIAYSKSGESGKYTPHILRVQAKKLIEHPGSLAAAQVTDDEATDDEEVENAIKGLDIH